MTVSTLKSKLAAYNGQPTSFFVRNGLDLLCEALNNARKIAEQNYDFEVQNIRCLLSSVDPVTGADLKNLTTDDGNATPVRFKAIETFYLRGTAVGVPGGVVDYPLQHTMKKNQAVWLKERNYRFRFWDYPYDASVPGDGYVWYGRQQLQVYLQGTQVQIIPQQAAVVILSVDAQLWMPDYLQDTMVNVSSCIDTLPNIALVAAAPSDIVIGTFILGGFVTVISDDRTILTLGVNCNQTLGGPSDPVPYSNMGTAVVNNSDYSDWMTENGSNYLFYSGLCELNYLTNMYALRAEGFNAPPEKARDAALQALVNWDGFMYQQGRQPKGIH